VNLIYIYKKKKSFLCLSVKISQVIFPEKKKGNTRMNSTSPAHSSISTTAIVGGSSSNAALSTEEFHIPPDLISIQERKDEALHG
jgi:hypothetical protein